MQTYDGEFNKKMVCEILSAVSRRKLNQRESNQDLAAAVLKKFTDEGLDLRYPAEFKLLSKTWDGVLLPLYCSLHLALVEEEDIWAAMSVIGRAVLPVEDMNIYVKVKGSYGKIMNSVIAIYNSGETGKAITSDAIKECGEEYYASVIDRGFQELSRTKPLYALRESDLSQVKDFAFSEVERLKIQTTLKRKNRFITLKQVSNNIVMQIGTHEHEWQLRKKSVLALHRPRARHSSHGLRNRTLPVHRGGR